MKTNIFLASLFLGILTPTQGRPCSTALTADSMPIDGLREIPRNLTIGPLRMECPESLSSSAGDLVAISEVRLGGHFEYAEENLNHKYCRPDSQLDSARTYYFTSDYSTIGFSVGDFDDVSPPSFEEATATRSPEKLRNPIITNSCDDLPPAVFINIRGLVDNYNSPDTIRFLVCTDVYCSGPHYSVQSGDDNRLVELPYQIPRDVGSFDIYPMDLSANLGEKVQVRVENQIGCSCGSTSSSSSTYVFFLLILVRNLRKTRMRSNEAL